MDERRMANRGERARIDARARAAHACNAASDDDGGVERSAQLSQRMPPRRSGRLAPPPPAVVQEYVLDPRLVSDVLAAVFALVPVDTRLRCREVSKAWRAFLDQPWLWQSVNLSPASGLVAKPTCALLRAATERAQGKLQVLDVSDCHGFTFPTLVEVVRANRETLTTLKSWCVLRRGGVGDKTSAAASSLTPHSAGRARSM
jgi:F-box domain